MRRARLLALGISVMLGMGLGPVGAAAVVPASAVSSGAVAIRAALPAPTLKVMPGATAFTVSWAKVAGATGYVVEYSTKSSFSGAKKISLGASTLHKIVKGLTNGVPYSVRVRAIAAAPDTDSLSAVKKVTPQAGYPRELDITVVPAGPDKVKVSWTGQTRATKVGVLAGSDSVVTKNLIRSAWYPATTTSITITVPASLRDEMGTGSGNPIHVKVATYNSANPGDEMPTKYDISRAYRLSPAGTYAFATPVEPSGEPLRVGTWNVRSVASSAEMTGYTWKDRRLKVRDNILYSGVELIGLQEINTAWAWDGSTKRQWQDLRDLLRPSGYEIATLPTEYDLKSGQTNGAHLYYKPAVLERLDGGFVSPRSMGIGWPSTLTDRLWSWAKFRTIATGAEFYAVSVHLPTDDNGNDRSKLRVNEAKAINAFMTDKAGDLPIVILGDLNNSILESGTGPDHALRVLGYYDAASAAQRVGYRYPSVNSSRQVDNLKKVGYPYTPYKAPHVAARIDYIMMKNAPGSSRYRNLLVLTSTGKFDPKYQGSDHNLQFADIGIPGGS